MLIKIKVIFGSGEPSMHEGTLVVHTTEKPERGMANRDVIIQVAKFYGVNQTSVNIIRGHKSRRKVLQVAETKGKSLQSEK